MSSGIVPGSLPWFSLVHKEAISDTTLVSRGSDGESLAEVEGIAYAFKW